MKKQILNIGKALNKAEQKEINGGKMLAPECSSDSDCYDDHIVTCENGVQKYCDEYGQCNIKPCQL